MFRCPSGNSGDPVPTMNTLIDSLATLASPWLYLVVAALAAAESAALVGLVLPGESALLIGGFAASQGHVSLPIMIATALVAAIAGDSVGYELGRRFGPRLRDSRVGLWVGEDRWAKAEASIERRGGPAVLVGRWVGLLRALVPGVAGMTRMPYRTFLLWNVLGAAIWAPAVVIGGYLAGNSFHSVSRVLGQASQMIALAAVVVAAVWLAARWAAAHRNRVEAVGRRLSGSRPIRQLDRWARSAAERLTDRMRPARAFLTIAGCACAVVGLMGWALAETFEAAVGAEGIASLDRPVANWFAAHRAGWLNGVAETISTMGGGIGAVAIAGIVGLIWWRRSGSWRPMLVIASSLGGAVVLSQAIKHLTARTRPPNSGHLFDGSAFPSGHTTAAVAIAGSIAWLYCQGRPWNRQVATWTIAALAALLVGWSRAYLSAHWLTDVIGGWMLGAAWLAAVVATDAILLRRNNQGVGPSADPQVPGAHSPGSPSPTAGRRSPS